MHDGQQEMHAGIVDYGRDRNDCSVFMISTPGKFDSSLIIIIISATKIIIIRDCSGQSVTVTGKSS
jgi:hypothetical protein